MRVEEHVEALCHDGERLAESVLSTGLDAAVPTCPGWQVHDLLRHLCGVHRWAASHVTTSRAKPYTNEEEQRFFATVADDALLDWFRTGHRDLVDALATADPDTSCWTFLPALSPLGFWARRQAHETAIHRADVEAAMSSVPQFEPAFAADGVDELLNGFMARRPGRITADPATSIALIATDTDANWIIHIEPNGHRVSNDAQPAALTVTGPASDLYLLLWNRTSVEHLNARGDIRALDAWHRHATVTWS